MPRERRERRAARFWVILGSFASVAAGLILATMVCVVVILLSPGGPDGRYCSAAVAMPGPFAPEAPDQRVEYRKEGTIGFPPKSTCSVYLVDARRPGSPPLRLLARTRYPATEPTS